MKVIPYILLSAVTSIACTVSHASTITPIQANESILNNVGVRTTADFDWSFETGTNIYINKN